MKYYKGINGNDELSNGGEYVKQTGDGGERSFLGWRLQRQVRG